MYTLKYKMKLPKAIFRAKEIDSSFKSWWGVNYKNSNPEGCRTNV